MLASALFPVVAHLFPPALVRGKSAGNARPY